ncbi:prolyl 4-hydroxylase subunit alpha-1-like isoform X2 [Periplaneta americana]|uniref:prolyl 4-hydroxylase subunit alpha-1-like isoform X2 n=1 Tax=Periplaneta americana TaxID=6978 RepID=UPI0037E94412
MMWMNYYFNQDWLATLHEREHEEASLDAHRFVTNPINAFLLIKRLTLDLKSVERIVENDILKAGDCLEIGIISAGSNTFAAENWFAEALHRYEKEDVKTAKKSDLLENLSYTMYIQGNIRKSLIYINELLKENPTHTKAVYLKAYFESKLRRKDNQNEDDIKKKIHDVSGDAYYLHCRLDAVIPMNIRSRLKCRYTDKGNAFLRLARVKEEELYLKPLIMKYHDIIYDREIETLISNAMQEMLPPTSVEPNKHQTEIPRYRVAKIAWFDENNNQFVAKVNQRASDIMGLYLTSAEKLQIVNYGIGGQYDPHFDFFREGEYENTVYEDNNRIATILFYLSDVKQGGATVFPYLNLTIRPQKGAAVVWYNLHRNGTGNIRTLHAACPVVVGSKWTINKWFHSNYQEFIRPCGLRSSWDED